MTDPETDYQRIASGSPAALRAAARTLAAVERRLDRAADDVHGATGVPVWTGQGATAFQVRAAGLLQGLRANHVVVSLAGGALETAASALDDALDRADHAISYWRNRPAALPPILEELLGSLVSGQLRGILADYDGQLTGVLAVLRGDQDVDLDALDDDTREWVEKGIEKTEDWLAGNGSSLGPLIPNTLATGDGRNLTPQGLGYDPASGTLIQSYVDEDGDRSGLALIDQSTGQELGEVQLGPHPVAAGEDPLVPGHVGGVSVDGDEVLVSSDGVVYTYSMNQIQNASPGEVMTPIRPPDAMPASSYNAVHDGQLYVGDFDENRMYVYDRVPGGGWTPALDSSGEPRVISTPDDVQGVAVRDDEIVYSTSHGRGNESSLIVHDRDGNQIGDPYTLPNMSEGIVEVDGEILATYESGAQEYSESGTGASGWFWGVPDDDGLWAGTHMTRTPLGELGLGEELEAEPASLRSAAAQLGDPAAALRSSAEVVAGVEVASSDLALAPTAPTLSRAIGDAMTSTASSLRTGAAATDHLAESLVATGTGYEGVDDAASRAFDALRALLG